LVQEASRTPDRLDQNRTSLWHIIIKTSTENRERILKVVREKKLINITDFSMKTLKIRRAYSEVFQALNENNFNPRILYPEKLSFKINEAIKMFHKQKLKQYITIKTQLQ
jgi:hypothetical protein